MVTTLRKVWSLLLDRVWEKLCRREESRRRKSMVVVGCCVVAVGGNFSHACIECESIMFMTSEKWRAAPSVRRPQ
jgi:hypothetical protein